MPTLDFKGKSAVAYHHLAVPVHALELDPAKSLTPQPSLDDNLIIHGDNLKALKALLNTHAGKIDCIYIDPPYNTGNENWVYNDNVNHPELQAWLSKVVDKEDMNRHDKWLCMMMPRIKLLRELLSDRGVIFISIDDNEQANLKLLLDEVFGERNFLANVIWHKTYSTKNDATFFSEAHDFIIVYSKNIDTASINLLPRSEKSNNNYKNDDNDGRGPYRTGDVLVKSFSKSGVFAIENPNTGQEFWPPEGSCYRFSKESSKKMLEENRFYFGKDGKGAPQLKRYLNEVKQGQVANTLWNYEEVGHNQDANTELKEILQKNKEFDTPKPVELLKRIITIGSSSNSIILDSFAGSGTTGHAVLELNKQDGGNRKFILVEQESYADSLTAERIRRVIRGVPESKEHKEGLGGSFSYFTLGRDLNANDLLTGEGMPAWLDYGRYIYLTASGQVLNDSQADESAFYLGEDLYSVYFLYYRPDLDWLKQNALTRKTLDTLKARNGLGKKRVVFGPACYVSQAELRELQTEFCTIPYEVYGRK